MRTHTALLHLCIFDIVPMPVPPALMSGTTCCLQVVSRILENVSALPTPSMADLVIFRSNGSEAQVGEGSSRWWAQWGG